MTLWANEVITIEAIAAEGMGKNLVAAIGKALNKASGNESSKLHGFNEGNWGATTRQYLKSVNNLKPASFEKIIKEAKQLRVTRASGDSTKTITEDGCDDDDKRALLVDDDDDSE